MGCDCHGNGETAKTAIRQQQGMTYPEGQSAISSEREVQTCS